MTYCKNQPAAFAQLTKKYPELKELTRDIVAKIKIGDKMHWYQVNYDLLPKTEFVHGKMEDFVQKAPSQHQRQIYIMTNSWGYLLKPDTTNLTRMDTTISPANLNKFLQVIRDIKAKNKGKDVWIVIGELEKSLLEQRPETMLDFAQLGMTPAPISRLKELGVSSLSPAEWGRIRDKIWKLET